MSGTLDTLAPRLGQLVRMLGSDSDGETLAAARAIGRTLASSGLSVHDLAARLECPPEIPVTCSNKVGRPTKPSAELPPILEQLKRSQKLAWLDHAAASTLLDEFERGLCISMRAQSYSQPHKLVSPKQCTAINTALGKLWLEGIRV